MKKLLILFLFLSLLCSSAVASDRDPIVGEWYMLVDGDLYPEFVVNFGDYTKLIIVYSFLADGSIMITENDISAETNNVYYTSSGKWEKKLSGYNYSIFGIGPGELKLDGDTLLLSSKTGNVTVSTRLRRMIPFDPYNDYVY